MVKKYMGYSVKTNTLIHKKGEFERIDSSSQKMNDRSECSNAKRKHIIKKRKFNENTMNSFADCLGR